MKMLNRWTFALIIPMVLFAGVIGMDKLDPFYKTKTTIPAEIKKRVYATGKKGTRIEITIKTAEGKEYWFNRSAYFTGSVGDKVKLRLYERKHMRLQKYELEYNN